MKLGYLLEGIAKIILKVALLALRPALLVCLFLDSDVVQLSNYKMANVKASACNIPIGRFP